MHNTKMERGALERKVADSESGNSIQEVLTVNKVTELRNLGTLAYSVKHNWENHLKNSEPMLQRE
jgi:hypothetical protein